MRLIDADAWDIELMTYGIGQAILGRKIKYTVGEVRSALAKRPTVETEPVKHGQWIEVAVGDCCYRCSECGFIRDAYLLDVGNYCPNCGAKMDKE